MRVEAVITRWRGAIAIKSKATKVWAYKENFIVLCDIYLRSVDFFKSICLLLILGSRP